MQAADGDYVQQLGIAGTNVDPERLLVAGVAGRPPPQPAVAGRDGRTANRRERFQAGAIVPEEGTTLWSITARNTATSSNITPATPSTRHKEWLLFHAEEVARRFYTNRVCQVA